VTEPADAERTYLDRRRRRRRLLLAGIAVAALLVVLSARRPDLEDPCDTPSAAPRAELRLMPARLSLERLGTVTRVRRDELYVTIQAVTSKPIDEAPVLLQDAVIAAGYGPAGIDTKRSEAEVFFTAGPYAGGQARVTQSVCEGRWDIELVLLDRDAERSRTTSTPGGPGAG
jgi:hypothetical protein